MHEDIARLLGAIMKRIVVQPLLKAMSAVKHMLEKAYTNLFLGFDQPGLERLRGLQEVEYFRWGWLWVGEEERGG